ncbi:MAG TPA: hypothetical protein VGP55_07345 [Chitinophagaceae bacterium]|nr:hypothetical protein [Chitinophagaceae bacterium]
MVTGVQNIIYSENQFAEADLNDMSGNNYSVRPSLINNNSKSNPFQKSSYKIFFFLSFFLLMGEVSIQAQQNVNYALYANIIYRFPKYIDRPPVQNFIIGIIGDTDIQEADQKMKIGMNISIIKPENLHGEHKW